MEAYGNAALDSGIASGAWDAAVGHAAERVETLVSETEIAEALADAGRWADLAPGAQIQAGSGWGALEGARRQRSGVAWVDATGTPFDASTIGPDQRPWLALLNSAADGSPSFTGAASFVRGEDWDELLAHCSGAEARLHRATLSHAKADPNSAGGLQTAVDDYRRTLSDATASAATLALAWRGLGLALLSLADAQGTQDRDSALDALDTACALEPGNRWLLIQAMTLTLAHGAPARALELASKASEPLRSIGRVQFLTAQAHALAGSPKTAAEMLRAGIEIADIREGENSISALWREVCPGDPVPDAYQFSMH